MWESLVTFALIYLELLNILTKCDSYLYLKNFKITKILLYHDYDDECSWSADIIRTICYLFF